ncbi:MAG: hypothetical protein AB7G17_01790 [Phycisphaerales bacterium]
MVWRALVVAGAMSVWAAHETWREVYDPACMPVTARRIGASLPADAIVGEVVEAIRVEEGAAARGGAVRSRLYSVLSWTTNGATARDGGIVLDNGDQVDALARGLVVGTTEIRNEILQTADRVAPGLRARLAEGLGACLRDGSHSVVGKAADVIRRVGVVDDAGRELLWELVERPWEANAAAWKSLEEWEATMGGIAGFDGRVLHRVYAAGARISCGEFDTDVERWGRLDAEGQRGAAMAVAVHVVSEHAPALTDAQHRRALGFVGGQLRAGGDGYVAADSLTIVMYLGAMTERAGADAELRGALRECVGAAKGAGGFAAHAEALRQIEMVVGGE